MKIDIAVLRECFEKLVANLEEDRGRHVPLCNDYYWDMTYQSRYNLESSPEDHIVGQLSEDWAELQDVASGKSVVEYMGLTRLANVLSALAEESVWGR